MNWKRYLTSVFYEFKQELHDAEALINGNNDQKKAWLIIDKTQYIGDRIASSLAPKPYPTTTNSLPPSSRR